MKEAVFDRQRSCYRAVALISAAATGAGMTILLIGISILHMPTVIVGTATMLVFLMSAIAFEAEANKCV